MKPMQQARYNAQKHACCAVMFKLRCKMGEGEALQCRHDCFKHKLQAEAEYCIVLMCVQNGLQKPARKVKDMCTSLQLLQPLPGRVLLLNQHAVRLSWAASQPHTLPKKPAVRRPLFSSGLRSLTGVPDGDELGPVMLPDPHVPACMAQHCAITT